MGKVKYKESFSYKLLKTLALGGSILIAASSPYFGLKILQGIGQESSRKSWRQFYNELYRLRRQKRINVSQNPDGSYNVIISNLGKKLVEKHELDDLEIKRPERWDGFWRFLSFDIPSNKKLARYSLLNKLKELGFIMAQNSLWAHPFECRKELAVIAHAFEVQSHVCFFVAHEADNDSWLREKFEKRNRMILEPPTPTHS